jgi:hypothetical protein
MQGIPSVPCNIILFSFLRISACFHVCYLLCYVLPDSAVLLGLMATSTSDIFAHLSDVLRFFNIQYIVLRAETVFSRLTASLLDQGLQCVYVLSLDLSFDPTRSLWLR